MTTTRPTIIRVLAAVTFSGLSAASLALGDSNAALVFALLLLSLTLFP